jgi:replicative DNA helicase
VTEDIQDIPLASIHAERTILGAILLENESFFEASQEISETDFYLDSHRRIYSAIARLMRRGSSADTTTVVEELRETRDLEAVGGLGYVYELVERIPRKISIASWVRLVKEKATMRELAAMGLDLADVTKEKGRTSDDLIGRLESQLLDIRAGREKAISRNPAQDVGRLMERMEAERTRTTELLGLPTGVRGLDLMMRGYQDGEFNIIGAKSGVGKTSLLAQGAIANAQKGTPTLLFSLEMTSEQLLRRILCIIADVPFPRVRDPKFATSSDMRALQNAAAVVSKWPLHIVDAAGISIERIVAASKLAIRREGVKLIGVDYVQIVHAPIKDERLRVASISRGLTSLAKEEQVPVVALSQLSRPDRSNPNRRPIMSDLRESGQLENDAHAIIFAHRDWNDELGKYESEGELIVAKQRSGETGSFAVEYDRCTLTFGHSIQASRQQFSAQGAA